MKKKPVIAMDLQSNHSEGAGPYVSTMNIINSNLKLDYNFQILTYDNSLGRGIRISRIIDLTRQLKKIKPDIVHFGGLQLSGLHIALSCVLAGVKNRVVTIHGFSSDNMEMNKMKRFILIYFVDLITLLLSTKIVGVSEFVAKRRLVRLFGSKNFGAIYNFPPEKQSAPKGLSIKETLNLSEDDVVVVTVSRITKEKGLNILANVIPQLSDCVNLKFVIVGIGDYLPTMQNQLATEIKSGRVFFLGYRNDVGNILQGCDIFVLPTLHETLSIALLEASIAGLPLIASDTGGVPEIVNDGENGYLFPVGDTSSLAEKIRSLYNRKDWRTIMGQKSIDSVQRKFSHQSIEQRLSNLYEDLLSK